MAATLEQDFPQLGMPDLAKEYRARMDQVDLTLGLAKLREPFPAHQISVFPKNAGQRAGLSYVGHAALTDRLLDADPEWAWEPLAFDDRGLPMVDEDGGMWIRLTVCGITRLGYGDAQGKTGGNAMKERIGDALRNAAMRFGAALDLWHKGDLHIEDPEPKKEAAKSEPASEWDKLDTETQEWMTKEAMAVTVMTADGDIEGAFNHLESLQPDDSYKTAFWSRLDSQQRSAIKACSQIVHAQTVESLAKAWAAVPKHAQAALTAIKDKRKNELQPMEAAA